MNINSLSFPIVLGLLLNLTGCSYAFDQLGITKQSPLTPAKIQSSAFSEQLVSFEVVKSLSLRTCLDCHTEGSRSMNTPEKVLAQKDKILNSIYNNSMPPRAGGYQPLTACEKQVLETWLEDQNNNRPSTQKVKDLALCGDAEAPKAQAPTDFANLEVTFENLKTKILTPKCLSCHTTETAKKTLLETTADLEKFLGESAETSLLYNITVPGSAKRFMPPKRSGIQALTEAEVKFLKKWIESSRN